MNYLLLKSITALTAIAFNCALTTLSINSPKPIDSTENLIAHIKDNNIQGHLKSFTFIQETIRFNKDGSPIDTITWYEAIRYPKDFRIDFGDPEKGNANINRNDSIYVYRNNKLVHQGPEIQEFLILEGGLYYYSVEETLERLESLGIDTKTFTKSTYNNKPIYIIGAVENNLSKPQIWMDAKELHAVRRYSKGKHEELYEVRYDDYKNINGHNIETWIEFWADGNLIQTERYNDIDTNPELTDEDFDPKAFGRSYWFKK